MPEGYRLGALKVRVPADYSALILFGFVRYRQNERFELFNQNAYLVNGIQPEIERYLIVARTRRMQLFADFAHPFGQRLLDKGVDIFGVT